MSFIESAPPVHIQSSYRHEQSENPLERISIETLGLIDDIADHDERIQREKEYMTFLDGSDPDFFRVYLRFGDKTGLYEDEIQMLEDLTAEKKLSFLQFIKYYPVPEQVVSHSCNEVVISIGQKKTFVIGQKPLELLTHEVTPDNQTFLMAINEAIHYPRQFYEAYILGEDY